MGRRDLICTGDEVERPAGNSHASQALMMAAITDASFLELLEHVILVMQIKPAEIC